MDMIRYLLDKFSTRAHFMRAIATLILLVAAYQVIYKGKVEDTWLILVGNVIGYYFKGSEHGEEDKVTTMRKTKEKPAKP